MADPVSTDVRVLLVDDQPQFRRAAAMLIQATDGVTLAGEAGSGEEAVALRRLPLTSLKNSTTRMIREKSAMSIEYGLSLEALIHKHLLHYKD